MSASFAKAVMPRIRREGEPDLEVEWAMGWTFEIKTDRQPGPDNESDRLLNEVARENKQAATRPDESLTKNVHD